MARTAFPNRLRGWAVLSVLVAAAVVAVSGMPRHSAAEDTGYVAGIADLPLMPGLEELPDAGVVFDKPAGRIVDAYAQGRVTPASVLDFYGKALPQLGWRAAG